MSVHRTATDHSFRGMTGLIFGILLTLTLTNLSQFPAIERAAPWKGVLKRIPHTVLSEVGSQHPSLSIGSTSYMVTN